MYMVHTDYIKATFIHPFNDWPFLCAPRVPTGSLSSGSKILCSPICYAKQHCDQSMIIQMFDS